MVCVGKYTKDSQIDPLRPFETDHPKKARSLIGDSLSPLLINPLK